MLPTITSTMAMTRSSLRESICRPDVSLWLPYIRVNVLMGIVYSDVNSELSTSSPMTVENNQVSNLIHQGLGCLICRLCSTIDIVSSIQVCFGLISKRSILHHVHSFRVGRQIWYADCTLILLFDGAMFICSINCIAQTH